MNSKKPLDQMTDKENLAEWTRRARAFPSWQKNS